MKTRNPGRFLLLVLMLVLCGGSAVAQPGDAREATLAELNAPEYAVRCAATEALMLDETLTTDQIAAWYAAAESPEAQQRLLAVARHHVLRQLRLERFAADGPGSIGVVQSMQVSLPVPNADGREDGPNANPPARPGTFALVTRVLEGFPAAGRLRPLDRVVALDSQMLGGPTNNQRFEDLMRRYRANQTLTLTIERDGETLDVAIPLANGNALGAMYAFPEFGLTPEFDQAWKQAQQTSFPERETNLAPTTD